MAKEDVFDPQTRRPSGKGGGQFLDKVTRHMLDTRLQADTLGESKDAKELAKMGLLTGMDTGTVQAYATQAINLIRKYNTSAADLKHVMPLLDEIENNAKADLTLSELERNHILQIVRKLRTFAASKLRLNNKIGAKLKGVVRAKTQQWKESLGENLSSSPSALFRLAGKALGAGREEEGPSRAEGESKGAIAKAAALFARRQGKTANSPALRDRARGSMSLSTWDEDEDDDLVSMSPGRVRSAGTGAALGTGGGAIGGAAGATLSKILTTDNQILSEVKGVKATLVAAKEQDAEQYELDDKARERGMDNAKKTEGPKADTTWGKLAKMFEKQKGGGQEKGWMETLTQEGLGTMIGNMLPKLVGSVLTSSLVTTFLPLLGGAAAIALLGGIAGKIMKDLGLDKDEKNPIINTAGEGAAALADSSKSFGERAAGLFKLGAGLLFSGPTGLPYAMASATGGYALGSTSHLQDTNELPAGMLDNATAPIAPSAPAPTPAPVASRSVGNAVGILPSGAGSNIDLTPQVSSPGPTTPEKVSSGVMRLSEKGAEQIRRSEGLPPGDKEAGPYHAYQDEGNVWTIGHGLTRIQGRPVKQGDIISAEEEKKEFHKQLATQYEPGVRAAIGNKSVSQSQYDAMVSMAYNIGVPAFASSTLAKNVAAGKEVTQDQFTRWNKVRNPKTGKLIASQGLTNRRQQEWATFASDLSSPSLAGPSPRGARSGVQLASATTAAGGGRSAGAPPTVIVTPSAPVVMAHQQAPTAIPIPIRVDNLDATVRAIRNISGTVLG